jgi:hypothetical protein
MPVASLFSRSITAAGSPGLAEDGKRPDLARVAGLSAGDFYISHTDLWPTREDDVCFGADCVEKLRRRLRAVWLETSGPIDFAFSSGAREASGTSYSCRREPAGHCSQILSRCSHHELVSRPAYASKPQSIELQNAFQVANSISTYCPRGKKLTSTGRPTNAGTVLFRASQHDCGSCALNGASISP